MSVKSGVQRRDLRRIAARPSLIAAAIAAALAGGVHDAADAAGLGRLTVQSALGQPLQAEVEITSATRDEIESLAARLAAPDAFRQAGMSFNPALASLRFAVERRADGRPFVRISSAAPINEPFVDLLVELNWANGRFVREYTFLLDPPELRAGSEVVEGNTVLSSVVPPVARTAATPVPAPVAATVPASSVQPRATPPAQPPPVATRPAAPASVTVQRGETLTEIANRVKPADVSVEQAVIAIYEANPRAFFGTVHQMYAGRSLAIPGADAMRAVDTAAARRQIRAEAAEFKAYRQRLADAAPRLDTAQAGTSAAGTVSPRVDEPAPAPAGDQLVLSRTEAAAASGAGAATATGVAGGQSAVETRVAAEAALREQTERVQLLEKNLADLQRLLELKNRQLAELQQQAEAGRVATTTGPTVTGTTSPQLAASPQPAATQAAATQAAGASQTGTPQPAAAPMSSFGDTAAGADSAPADSRVVTAGSDTTLQAAGSAADPAVGAGPGESVASAQARASVGQADAEPAGGPAATDVAALASTAGTQPAAATTEPEPASVPVSTPSPAPVPTSFVDELLASRWLMPGLVALIVALGGYGWYTMRRRREIDEHDESVIAADAFTANSLFGATGGQAVDTGETGMFGHTAHDTASDPHPTEVDPIAEAEVYIAYGREAQAEEILREALRRQPERQAIRMKLLEILAGRRDAAAFGVVAAEMFEMTGGENEEWPRVVALGESIDASNPLYEAAPGDDVVDADDLEPAEVEGDGYGEFDSFAQADEAAPDTGIVLGVSPVSDGSPDDQRREFAETRDMMQAADAPDTGASLDFGLNVDTSIGRPDELTAYDAGTGSFDDVADAVRGLTGSVSESADNPGGSLLDGGGGEGTGTELERAVAGRFELPSLDFIEDDPEPLADARDDHVGMPGAGGSVQRAGAGDHDDLPALGSAGELHIELPALDLQDTLPAHGQADHEQALADDGDFGALDFSSGSADSPQWQEMATKLDLASAYEEIGDKDGARELLEEVLRDGDQEHQRKARAMLERIS
ncbi:MAG: FimV/HubP family polar landmark protein [Burkholderiaceae bacterium]